MIEFLAGLGFDKVFLGMIVWIGGSMLLGMLFLWIEGLDGKRNKLK